MDPGLPMYVKRENVAGFFPSDDKITCKQNIVYSAHLKL